MQIFSNILWFIAHNECHRVHLVNIMQNEYPIAGAFKG